MDSTCARFTLMLLSCAMLFSGCGGGNKNAKLPDVREPNDPRSAEKFEQPKNSAPGKGVKGEDTAELETGTGEKKSFIGRVFGNAAPAGYTWDGQYSIISTPASPDIVYNRAGTALRNLGFVLNSQQSQFRGTSAQIVAARQSDGSSVQVLIAQKPNSVTEIKAKIGALGDRTGSERVLDEIQKPRGSARN
jgi:hypothetical protein